MMGAVEVEPAEDLYQAVKVEECVGEGGHFFERDADSAETQGLSGYPVTCCRCYITGIESPDPGESQQ